MQYFHRFRDIRDRAIDTIIDGIESRLQDYSYRQKGYTKRVYAGGTVAYEKILPPEPRPAVTRLTSTNRPEEPGDATV